MSLSRSFQRAFSLMIFLLVIGLLSQARAQEPTNHLPSKVDLKGALTLDKPVSGNLVSDENHYYTISLKKDQFCEIIAEQNGIDLTLSLYDPSGKEVMIIDMLESIKGREELYWVAAESGDYILQINGYESGKDVVGYVARLTTLHMATADDLALIGAEKLTSSSKASRIDSKESILNSIELLKQAAAGYHKLSNIRGEAYCYFQTGGYYEAINNKTAALEYLERASVLMDRSADKIGMLKVGVSIALTYHYACDYQRAMTIYNRLLPVSRETGEQATQSTILGNIASIYAENGEIQKAFDFQNQALTTKIALGNQNGQAVTLCNLGKLCNLLGEYQQALDYFKKSLPHFNKVKNSRGEGFALSLMGDTYLSMGDYQQALDCFNQALPLRSAVGDRRGEATTLGSLGQLSARQGNYQQALEYFNKSLPIVREVEYRSGQIATLNKLGETYQSLNNFSQAGEKYREALPIALEIGDRKAEATTRYLLAKLAAKEGRFAESRRQVEEAIRLVEAIRSSFANQEQRALYFATIIDYYKLYIDLLMQMHLTMPKAGPKAGSNTDLSALALQVNERSRARSLLELLTEASANIREGVDAKLLDEEQHLQQLINGKEQQRVKLLSSKHSDEQERAALAELESLYREYKTLETEIRQQSPRYAALTQPQIVTIAELQQDLLDADSMLLEYSLGETRSYLWAVTPTSLESFLLPDRATIEAAAKRAYQQLRARPISSANNEPGQTDLSTDSAALAELSHIILGPIADRLGKKRLLIVSDGALQYISFAALPEPVAKRENSANNVLNTTADYRPLIVDHEIINLPSISTLAVLRQERNKRRPASNNVAVLADPVFNRDDTRLKTITIRPDNAAEKQPSEKRPAALADERILDYLGDESEESDKPKSLKVGRLPFTREEAEEIVGIAGEKSLKALDFQASKAIFARESLKNYGYLHFATHGYFDSARPERSALVLSLIDEHGELQDGFLRAGEIFNLNLPAELVVLSACRTGLGKDIKGEGLIGLTRGFMYAGAARVVVSLWSVNDRATAELMKRFYQGMLKDGLSPAAALRAAQLAMWQQQQWQKPYYWAAFQLQGEYRK